MSMAPLGQLADMAAGHLRGGDVDCVVEGVGTDTRESLRGQLFVALEGPRFDGHTCLAEAAVGEAAAAMVRRGTPPVAGLPLIEVDDTRQALGRLARAWRSHHSRVKVVAITGTVGKTSTKDLLFGICRDSRRTQRSPKSFNNDVGVPLTILSVRPEHELLIAEVGTNAPGEILPLADMLKPDVGLVTLVGRGHLEGLGTLEQVAEEKYALLHAVRPGGVRILADQPHLRSHSAGVNGVTFGVEASASHRLIARGPGWMKAFDRRWDLAVPGLHGALNAMAAILAARAVGLGDDDIARGLAETGPSSQRLRARAVGERLVIDDCWNANPESVEAALTTLPELVPDGTDVCLVLGDMLELGHAATDCHAAVPSMIAAMASRLRLHQVVLVGPLMAAVATAAAEALPGTRIHVEPVADDAAMKRVASTLPSSCSLLLKGSRGLALERISRCLESEAEAV